MPIPAGAGVEPARLHPGSHARRTPGRACGLDRVHPPIGDPDDDVRLRGDGDARRCRQRRRARPEAGRGGGRGPSAVWDGQDPHAGRPARGDRGGRVRCRDPRPCEPRPDRRHRPWRTRRPRPLSRGPRAIRGASLQASTPGRPRRLRRLSGPADRASRVGRCGRRSRAGHVHRLLPLWRPGVRRGPCRVAAAQSGGGGSGLGEPGDVSRRIWGRPGASRPLVHPQAPSSGRA